MVEQKVLFSSLKTPAVLVDMDKLEANIREMSQLAVEAGVKLRPHTKVHGSVAIDLPTDILPLAFAIRLRIALPWIFSSAMTTNVFL